MATFRDALAKMRNLRIQIRNTKKEYFEALARAKVPGADEYQKRFKAMEDDSSLVITDMNLLEQKYGRILLCYDMLAKDEVDAPSTLFDDEEPSDQVLMAHLATLLEDRPVPPMSPVTDDLIRSCRQERVFSGDSIRFRPGPPCYRYACVPIMMKAHEDLKFQTIGCACFYTNVRRVVKRLNDLLPEAETYDRKSTSNSKC